MNMSSLKSETIPELVDRQNLIIKEQADIINSLLLLLMNYISCEEADSLKEVKKTNEIAKLRKRIGENENDIHTT